MYINDIEIRHGLALAPLAGVSDCSFRSLARRFGAEYTVSEMVSAKALCYEQRCRRPVTEERTRTAPLAAVLCEELPMAVQLFGAEPEFMARAAQLLESNEYRGACGEVPPSVIDVNMGCPMAKIVGNGEGSALMKNPLLAAEIVRAMTDAVKIPVTVKIRAGWDDGQINAVELAKRLEDAGASMICVHGRTREQMYAGHADWEIIRRVKEAVRIPVMGNGDIFCADDALRMLDETGCDGVMVARGAQGNPWIFAEILAAMVGEAYAPPALKERFAVALEHARLLVTQKGERTGIAESRKHMAWYLHGIRGGAAARNAVMNATSLSDIERIFGELLANNP
ncbi:MAG: tRNA dihydrouridine synthase DusB [Clostridia bacterium]|nr:tRNA dihydrouridine synthase DusB [Clostridia bacterium]